MSIEHYAGSASPLCRARSPEALAYMPSNLDMFAIWRSQTTGVNWLYRHEEPNGPKEVPPLHPEPFSKRAITVKPAARLTGLAQHPKSKTTSGLEDLHVYSTPDCEEP